MKIPILSIMFLIIFLGSFWLLGRLHEEAHVAIFENYNSDSTIQYWKGFLPQSTTGKCFNNSDCELAHSINESVGYQILPFFILIGGGLLSIIIFLESREE